MGAYRSFPQERGPLNIVSNQMEVLRYSLLKTSLKYLLLFLLLNDYAHSQLSEISMQSLLIFISFVLMCNILEPISNAQMNHNDVIFQIGNLEERVQICIILEPIS